MRQARLIHSVVHKTMSLLSTNFFMIKKRKRAQEAEKSWEWVVYGASTKLEQKVELLFIQLFHRSDSKDYQCWKENANYAKCIRASMLNRLNADLRSSLVSIKTSLAEECSSCINNVYYAFTSSSYYNRYENWKPEQKFITHLRNIIFLSKNVYSDVSNIYLFGH